MPKAIDIDEVLSGLVPLEGRSASTSEEDVAAAFATVFEYDRGGVFLGSFSGESEWECHPVGDELVQVISGQTFLTILDDTDEKVLNLSAGMLTVVPQSRWHRFNSENGVTLLTMTPQPTEHSKEKDPRRN